MNLLIIFYYKFFFIAFNNFEICYIILSIFFLIFELFEQKNFNTIILNSVYTNVYFLNP